MNFLNWDTLNLCFRWERTWQRFCKFLSVLLALNLLGILSVTSASAVELVSVNKDGTDSGNDLSGGPVISADGRFVVFTSDANNLVATDTNSAQDVFVRDRQSGSTTLVSVNKDGTDSGNNFSGYPVISADGRFVAFGSYADNLGTADTDGALDVFVRDLRSGSTSLVSVNNEGTDSGNGWSYNALISADGRFVAFDSGADNLVAVEDCNSTNDVFVRDLQSGTTTLVSVNKDGTCSGNDYSSVSAISANGRFVVFGSDADNLVTADTNGRKDVFVRDLQSGTTTLVSTNKDGTGSASGNSNAFSISEDGRFIAFQSQADDLVATNTTYMESNVYVRDLNSRTTTLVSINKVGNGSGNSSSEQPAISANGRFVVFYSWADDLVAADSNGTGDVFVRDIQSGTTSLVSINKDGTGSANDNSFSYGISDDGRFVAFGSYADDLVATDINANEDVFVRDLQNETTTLVSVNKYGTDSGNYISADPVISADGRFVAFSSAASDLVAVDNNHNDDVFIFEVPGAAHGCNCADPVAIKGTSGRDFLFGTEQADIICGFGGQDFIAGMGGDDCIDGGDGNDWIDGGHGNDTIFGRAGKDVIYGDRGNDVISGDEDEDYLFGGSGDDKLDGGEGYDWIFCDGGTDEAVGEYMWKCEN